MEINIVLVMLDSIPCLVGNDLSEAESKEMEKSLFFFLIQTIFMATFARRAKRADLEILRKRALLLLEYHLLVRLLPKIIL